MPCPTMRNPPWPAILSFAGTDIRIGAGFDREATPQDFAKFTDRVRIAEKKKQDQSGVTNRH